MHIYVLSFYEGFRGFYVLTLAKLCVFFCYVAVVATVMLVVVIIIVVVLHSTMVLFRKEKQLLLQAHL